MTHVNIDEALSLTRRALAAADQALSAIASLEQLQERFESAVLPLVEQPDLWPAARSAQEDARRALFHARGCLEEMQAQIAGGQAVEIQARAWANQFVDLNERVQAALANAGQQATRSYELMRPVLIAHYLEHATRLPRWAETWPFDVDAATRALDRLEASTGSGLIETLDIQLGRFRWEVGWPQQRIAAVVGLSQPSVAARLARMETVVSLEVGMKHVRDQAEKEHFRLSRSHALAGRGARGPVGELVVEGAGHVLRLELLVAPGETSPAKRGPAADRMASASYFRLEAAERRQQRAERVVNGVAVYFRDRGSVGYYTTPELTEAVRRLGPLPIESLLQRMREMVEPAWSLEDLLQRTEKLQTSSEGPEV